jgi:ubiquinone/menaquinone biosynthesis C-methylase UbiE
MLAAMTPSEVEPSGGARGDAPVVFDRVADSYDATRGFPPGVEERVTERVLAAGRLGPTSRVLEIGVGTGRIALPLAGRVEAVIGIDLSAPMLARLEAKRGGRPVFSARADAGCLPFPAASFDAVIGVHVFHLLPRWREALREVARVLRPGAPLLHAADDASGGEVWAEFRRRIATENGLENVGVPRARFEDFPEHEGWTLAGEVQRVAFTRALTPQALLDRLERRSWSLTWNLGDAELARLSAALRAELLARHGALDAPLEIPSGFWIRAYLPPRGA